MNALVKKVSNILKSLMFVASRVICVRVRLEFSVDMIGVAETAEMPSSKGNVRKPPPVVSEKVWSELFERLGVRHHCKIGRAHV